MTFSNPYFTAALTIVVVLFLLDLVATLLNLSALRGDLPATFRDVFDPERYRKSQDYTRETSRFGLIEATFSLAVFLGFWLLGGFGWLDGLARSWGLDPLATGVITIGLLFVATQLLSLPFEAYDTFVIEEKFGFNKTTPATFLADRIKGFALAAVIGLPLAALVLYLFARFEHAWLYAWVTVTAISLALTYVAPKFILPLFNKFAPLEAGELKSAIQAMGEKCGYPVREISVMDGSKRSSKANAFFTGFGKNKKIALFDTLIENHTTPELVAVLAHEIGHFKKKHILQAMVLGVVQTGILFFLLGQFLSNPGLFAAFGVDAPASPPDATSAAFGLIFFGILYKPVSQAISVAMAVLSRKNEFEADAYAAEVTGDAASMATALKKLAADSLSNLTPHPFYVFMNYSHPPMLERLRALGQATT